ncbi:hypothetical protein Peur_005146 [Populus x canadensis]
MQESFQRFPFEESYLSEEKANKTWFERNADSVELMMENDDSEKERVKLHAIEKFTTGFVYYERSLTLCLAGLISHLLQHRFEELAAKIRFGRQQKKEIGGYCSRLCGATPGIPKCWPGVQFRMLACENRCPNKELGLTCLWSAMGGGNGHCIPGNH